MRELREARGWSQAALAERIEVSVHYVGLLERGQRLPSLGTFVHLGRELGVRLDALLESRAEDWTEDAIDLLRRVPEAQRPFLTAILRAAAGFRAPRVRR